MGLLGLAATKPRRCILDKQSRIVAVVMLHAVLETQNMHHDQVGCHVQHCHLRVVIQQREENTTANQNHQNVSRQLVAALRNDECGEHRDEVHEQIVRGYVEPLEKFYQFHQPGMAIKEFLVHKPDRIVIVHVMAKMLVPNVLEGAVGSPANPVQKTAQARIGIVTGKHRIVAAFVDHVSRNRHGMAQQERGAQVDQPVITEQSEPADNIATHGV